MYRQGDLIIMKLGEIPKNAKIVSTGIVLEGEATGHNHRLVGGEVFSVNGAIFLDVNKSAQLVHEEHKPIVLGKGKYSVIRQKEYVSADMVRIVQD